MFRIFRLAVPCLVLGLAVLHAGAVRAEDVKDPRVALLKRLPPGAKLEDLRPGPIQGTYEFMQGADLSYLTADGKFFIDGNVYDMDTRQNLSEARRAQARVALIGALPESQMLIFSPENPRYTVTVFTDVDCQYCRALHKQIAEYNRLGVKVRYMFYPRTGPNTSSWSKAEQVWCSPDRRAALTAAKLGTPLKAAVCQPNPVAEQYALGKAIGLNGTPGIVTERGDLLPGYAPPDEMLQELQLEAEPGKG